MLNEPKRFYEGETNMRYIPPCTHDPDVWQGMVVVTLSEAAAMASVKESLASQGNPEPERMVRSKCTKRVTASAVVNAS